MKLITSNQDLIEGRRYLCRSKQPFTNGTFPKPTLEKVTSRNEGNRKVRLLGGEWSFDKADRILSFDGEDRLAKEAIAINLAKNPTKPISHYLDHIRENPFQTSYFDVPVLDTDYIENSQALKKWDVIGPIPEIKEEILHALFEYPSLIECFNKPISLHPDGDIAVIIKDGNYVEDEVWHLISDQEDLKEVITILEDQEKPFTLNPEHFVDIPGTWNEGQVRCNNCNGEMVFNAPSDAEGGFVHRDTGKFECEINASKPDEHGFVTTESCGNKVGKQIRLTEKKHNQFGFYNEGAILTINNYISDVGYTAGISCKENSNTTNNVVTVGFDGFEFVD